MTERPIIFSGPMVRAILSGLKTQTRRIIKPQPPDETTGFVLLDNSRTWMTHTLPSGEPDALDLKEERECPYGQPGDRLWVRERCIVGTAHGSPVMVSYTDENWGFGEGHKMHADAPPGSDGWCLEWKKKSPIHMPRWASRITLEITAVRVERLQDISEENAVVDDFWEDGYAASWVANPWVWTIEFQRIQ